MITLKYDDPIVGRALQVDNFNTWTEVGFIPGDKCGCKIYARSHRPKDGANFPAPRLLGMHNSTYGCRIEPQLEKVELK